MLRTKVIYEEPSPLSQGLVIGLSVAVVAMAAWFAATVANTRTVTITTGQAGIEADTNAAVMPLPPGNGAAVSATSGSGVLVSNGADASPQQTSVHFDWPTFRTVPETPPR